VKILHFLKRVVFLPFDRSDRISELDRREIENDDAAASAMGAVPAEFPPNYVRPADEGRPRH
jgi:hypothetical protein